MKILSSVFLSIILYLLSVVPAFAEVKISDEFGPAKNIPDLGTLISALLPNVFVLTGIIFFVILIFGGLSLIMSVGKGDSQGQNKGKNTITWAITGLILIFASYWIIQLVEALTGIDIFKPNLK